MKRLSRHFRFLCSKTHSKKINKIIKSVQRGHYRLSICIYLSWLSRRSLHVVDYGSKQSASATTDRSNNNAKEQSPSAPPPDRQRGGCQTVKSATISSGQTETKLKQIQNRAASALHTHKRGQKHKQRWRPSLSYTRIHPVHPP